MKRLTAFLKHNVMFVVILLLIAVITLALVFYQMLNQPAQEDVPAAEEEQQTPIEPGEETTASITDFQGSMSKDNVITLSWEVDSGDQAIVRAVLYYEDEHNRDIELADVTNHTSYQLAQDAYQFKSGENRFKIVYTLADQQTIEAKTSVQIIQLEQVAFQKEVLSNGVRMTLQYTYPSGSDVDVPLASYYDVTDDGFSIHYEKSETREENGKTVAAVTYFMNDEQAAKGEQSFTVAFLFPKLNKQFEYRVKYEKQAAEEGKENADKETTEGEAIGNGTEIEADR